MNNYIVYLTVFFLLYSCNKEQKNKFILELNNNKNLMTVIASADSFNGDKVYFYNTGEIFGIERFKNGLKHGPSRFFYKSGFEKSDWEYYEGKPDGHCYNYGDSYDGYPMEFLVYGGDGQLVFRRKRDSTGNIILEEGGIPKEWLEKSE